MFVSILMGKAERVRIVGRPCAFVCVRFCEFVCLYVFVCFRFCEFMYVCVSLMICGGEGHAEILENAESSV